MERHEEAARVVVASLCDTTDVAPLVAAVEADAAAWAAAQEKLRADFEALVAVDIAALAADVAALREHTLELERVFTRVDELSDQAAELRARATALRAVAEGMHAPGTVAAKAKGLLRALGVASDGAAPGGSEGALAKVPLRWNIEGCGAQEFLQHVDAIAAAARR